MLHPQLSVSFFVSIFVLEPVIVESDFEGSLKYSQTSLKVLDETENDAE